MVTKDNKDDRKRAEKALEAAGFKVAKVTTEFNVTKTSSVFGANGGYFSNQYTLLSKCQ